MQEVAALGDFHWKQIVAIDTMTRIIWILRNRAYRVARHYKNINKIKVIKFRNW
jgi:hypothetical protein